MNTAIIVAAGSGKRFGGDTPKQFLKINGKSVLTYTIEKFQQCVSIDEIILVISKDMIADYSDEIKTRKFCKVKKIVAGGESRAESVSNGLSAVESKNVEIIAVHDGARPLVSPQEIAETIEKAKLIGAACLVADVTDTIKIVNDGKIIETIDRTKLRRALTPQCFRYDILKLAFDEHNVNEIATDECFIVEKMGFEIAEVLGNANNIKITHSADLKIAELFLSEE